MALCGISYFQNSFHKTSHGHLRHQFTYIENKGSFGLHMDVFHGNHNYIIICFESFYPHSIFGHHLLVPLFAASFGLHVDLFHGNIIKSSFVLTPCILTSYSGSTFWPLFFAHSKYLLPTLDTISFAVCILANKHIDAICIYNGPWPSAAITNQQRLSMALCGKHMNQHTETWPSAP